MTVRVFAERLGAAVRTVAYWESRAAAVTPQPDMQAALDTLLARSDADVQSRFKVLLADQIPAPKGEDEQLQRERLVDELLDRLAEAAGAAGLTRPDRPGEAVRRALREANRLTVAIASLPAGEGVPLWSRRSARRARVVGWTGGRW
jgi:transcriptional regulator with XRE-family HTH domain